MPRPNTTLRSWRHDLARRLPLLLLGAAACGTPTDDAPAASAIAGAIDPALADRLATADPAEAVELDVQLELPRLVPAPLPPVVMTMESRGELVAYTVDGLPVSEAALARRASDERAAINADLTRQFADREAAVDEAIRAAGVEDAVVERGLAGFRARLPAARAGEMLAVLGSRATFAALPPVDREETDLTADIDAAGVGALDDIGVIGFAHAYGMTGAGIGIWHNEGYAPNLWRSEFDDADVRLLTTTHWEPTKVGDVCRYNDECCSGLCGGGGLIKTCQNTGNCSCVDANGMCVPGTRTLEHSTMVALVAHRTAPAATIYHTSTPSVSPSSTLLGCMIYPDIVQPWLPPVYVGTQSWSIEGDGASNGSYNVLGSCGQYWDDFIRSSRIAHFHSSGNSDANYVGSPARTYNVNAVGRYNHVTGVMDAQSGYKNPSTGAEKPEFVAPGTNIMIAPGWQRSGSSISSPIAAGMAADMMSGSAFFRNQPQAIKAYLIAGAHDVDAGIGFEGGLGAKDGAGRIDYLNTYFYRAGKIWANGGNGAWFNAQSKIIETYQLTAGKRYSIAIAWLADGKYAHDQTAANSSSTLDQRMKLTVSRNGTTYTGYQAKNNFQRVEFVAPSTGTWTVTIERTFNAGVGNVDLALTVGEHD